MKRDFKTGYRFYKRPKRSNNWSKHKTLKLYEVLNTIKTNFTFTCELFFFWICFNACVKNCNRALEINSAAAFKFCGQAYTLLGQWRNAAKSLRKAFNIDFDKPTDEWPKEVTPNAKIIEQYKLIQEKKKKVEKRAV